MRFLTSQVPLPPPRLLWIQVKLKSKVVAAGSAAWQLALEVVSADGLSYQRVAVSMIS